VTNRDAIKLAKRVEFWQHRLAALGLGHWRIGRVSIVSQDDMPGDRRAKASVQCEPVYDTCDFWFEYSFLEGATEKEVDEVILHEWVHVFMRDLDQAVESIENALSPGVGEQWEDWVDHEREGLVDRMARQFYALYMAEAEAKPAKIAQIIRASR
jgi:hypothetical protein